MPEDPLARLTAQSIAGVIDSLDRIVAWSKEHASPLGYFAALYRRVTVEVARSIEDGRFEDGPRMERLDVTFANRYLDAVERHRAGRETTCAWEVAFAALRRWPPIVLQHQMIGMSAHINLDLGIAAAATCGAQDLAALRHDFFAINDILAGLVDDVQRQLADVWPLMRLIDLAAGRGDELVASVGMSVARERAWALAKELAALPREQWPAEIDRRDRVVAALGGRLLRPRPLLRATLLLIRLGELGSVARVIERLE
jgi:hypothetical protein